MFLASPFKLLLPKLCLATHVKLPRGDCMKSGTVVQGSFLTQRRQRGISLWHDSYRDTTDELPSCQSCGSMKPWHTILGRWFKSCYLNSKSDLIESGVAEATDTIPLSPKTERGTHLRDTSVIPLLVLVSTCSQSLHRHAVSTTKCHFQ